MPATEKDLPDLASINPHDPGIWVTWAYVLITEWLDYYKRVTFFDLDRYRFPPRLAEQFRNPCP